MRSRQISAARPSSYRRMPATARRPISKRWRTATSMPMWRPAGPGTPWPARGTARSLPRCSCRRRPTYQRASRPCTPRSEPAATPAPIGCASNCPSRCSGRSNRLAAFGSSCCAGSRACAPRGPSSAPSLIFCSWHLQSCARGEVCPPRCRRPLQHASGPPKGVTKPSHPPPTSSSPPHYDNLDRLLVQRVHGQNAARVIDQHLLQIGVAETLAAQPGRKFREQITEVDLFIEQLRILLRRRAARIEEPAIVGDHHLVDVTFVGELNHEVRHRFVELRCIVMAPRYADVIDLDIRAT